MKLNIDLFKRNVLAYVIIPLVLIMGTVFMLYGMIISKIPIKLGFFLIVLLYIVSITLMVYLFSLNDDTTVTSTPQPIQPQTVTPTNNADLTLAIKDITKNQLQLKQAISLLSQETISHQNVIDLNNTLTELVTLINTTMSNLQDSVSIETEVFDPKLTRLQDQLTNIEHTLDTNQSNTILQNMEFILDQIDRINIALATPNNSAEKTLSPEEQQDTKSHRRYHKLR